MSTVEVFVSSVPTSSEEAVEDLDSQGENRLGHQLVAKAWADPGFKVRFSKAIIHHKSTCVQDFSIQVTLSILMMHALGTCMHSNMLCTC